MSEIAPSAHGRPLWVTGVVALIAPLAAVAIKGPSGWYAFALIPLLPVFLGGYVLLALAVVRSMLRPRGSLRKPAFRRPARLWAWTTSIGVVLLALTVVDAGTGPQPQSIMTALLGASQPWLLAVSSWVGWVSLVAWLAGWAGLLLTWSNAVCGRLPGRVRGTEP